MESRPSLTMYNLGLIGWPARYWYRAHRPVVAGLLGSRTAVLSMQSRVTGFTDPIFVRLPLAEGESYILDWAVYLSLRNWPYGYTLTFPEKWPPT